MLNEGFPPPIQLVPRAVGWKAAPLSRWRKP
ncbi:AlpA family phage regulatory protein [Comamonas sp.]